MSIVVTDIKFELDFGNWNRFSSLEFRIWVMDMQDGLSNGGLSCTVHRTFELSFNLNP